MQDIKYMMFDEGNGADSFRQIQFSWCIWKDLFTNSFA